MANMQPEIVSRATIKPSSPTPIHLRNYKLSLLDQLSPKIHMPIVLFYPNVGCDTPTKITAMISDLHSSLSHTLARYYPLAGRLADRASVDCNDEGVDFFEVRTGCRLSELLRKPEPRSLDLLYPSGVLWNDSYKGSLAVFQATFFSCGGMAISVCILHKLGDAFTVSAFIHDWAATTARSGETARPPEFISTSILNNDLQPILPESKIEKGNCFTRRFLFSAQKLAELKSLVTHSGVDNPTRVEVVTALIYKCAMAASKATSRTNSRPSMLIQPVNLRTRIIPPLPENSPGNFSWFFSIVARDESDQELHKLVGSLKKGMQQFCDKFAKNLTVEQCYLLVCESMKQARQALGNGSDGTIDVYKCSSLCRFPFYRMNFGWGKPIWAGTSSTVLKNSFHMLDGIQPDSIEACVTLEEQDMAVFEQDKELLAFASLNPSVDAEIDFESVTNDHV